MEHVPPESGETRFPVTVQIEPELLVNVTVNPDDALAERVCSASVVDIELG
jgi:hypothetical protein